MQAETLSVFENDFVTVREMMLPAADGTLLYTVIAVPQGVSACPTVMDRTPYAHRAEPGTDLAASFEDDILIRAGYARVSQHCRGCGSSEGECIPFRYEETDGEALLEHIRRMPHYDGSIFLAGGSYKAHLLFPLLLDPAPDIKGAVLYVSSPDFYARNYTNGMNRKASDAAWWLKTMRGERHPLKMPVEEAIVRPYRDVALRAAGEDFPPYTDTLLHNTRDDFWLQWPTDFAQKLRVPTLFLDGWFDFYTEEMCRLWETLNPAIRPSCCFIMGPYGHGISVKKDLHDYPFPNGNMAPKVRMVFADWFDHILTGKPFAYGTPGRFRCYTIGGDCWHETDISAEKPFPGHGAENPQVSTLSLYFSENGYLLSTSPESGSVSYHYDPTDPPRGFAFYRMAKAFAPGSVPGVFSFFSEPFAEDTDFFGAVRWHMSVRSDCEDTAFFMRLYLEENGEAYNLTETVTSLSHICPDYVPGRECSFGLACHPIAFRVKKGCRLRADISSAADNYLPHANVRGHFALITETKEACNTLLFGESRLELFPAPQER